MIALCALHIVSGVALDEGHVDDYTLTSFAVSRDPGEGARLILAYKRQSYTNVLWPVADDWSMHEFREDSETHPEKYPFGTLVRVYLEMGEA